MPEKSDSMIHIAICDDEAADRRQTEILVKEIMGDEGIIAATSTYESAEPLLTAIKSGVRFDILLLDVMMDNLDGMELAAALRELGDDTSIVFISSNREMALRGYEVEAARYLGKPLERPRLKEALLFCVKKLQEKKEILLPTRRGQRSIPYSQIVFGEAVDRVTRLTLSDGAEEVTLKFSQLAEQLPERQFVLCHRSYFVNLDYASYLRSRELELSTGAVLPVSKYRLEELQRRMVSYFSGR